MKTTKFIILLMLLFSAASCDKEEQHVGGAEDQQPDPSLVVRMEYSQPATYSLDTPVTGPTTVHSAILYQMSGTSVVLSRQLSAADIAAMASPSGYRIARVLTTIDGIYIVGNAPESEVSALLALPDKTALENYPFPIEMQQSTVANPGVDQILMAGFGAATQVSANYKEVQMTLKSAVARLEVSGQTGISADVSNQLATVTWTGVFFNRYYADQSRTSWQQFTSTSSEWTGAYPAFAYSDYTTDTESGTQCYAWQFFPHLEDDAEKLPMLVLRGDVTLKNGQILHGYYVTVKTYKKAGVPLLKMEYNKTYKISLDDLSLTLADFTPQPDAERVGLSVGVTVTPWVVKDYPSII